MQGAHKLFQTKSISKTTNPKWNETFDAYVDNPFKEIAMQVFDHDVVGNDDFMGEASFNLIDLDMKRTNEMHLPLIDSGNEDLIKKNKKRKPLGTIHFTIPMVPVSKDEMAEVRGDAFLFIACTHCHG